MSGIKYVIGLIEQAGKTAHVSAAGAERAETAVAAASHSFANTTTGTTSELALELAARLQKIQQDLGQIAAYMESAGAGAETYCESVIGE